MNKVKLTMLCNMASKDFREAVERFVELGLTTMDLKRGLFGKSVQELTVAEAGNVKQIATAAGLDITCLSSAIFGHKPDADKDPFCRQNFARLDHLLDVAEVLQPTFIRLLAPGLPEGADRADMPAFLAAEYPWLYDAYRQAARSILDRGFTPTIENEGDSIFTDPASTAAFFDTLGLNDQLKLTWDVQNMWLGGGHLPTLDDCDTLRPYLGYLHLKGGMGSSEEPDRLVYASTLEDAHWPVRATVERIIGFGVSPVICLNSSHGKWREAAGHAQENVRNIAFLRASFPEIE